MFVVELSLTSHLSLEQRVQLLRDAGQQIPQPVAILLAEARAKEDKRTAKRAANRKSACSSRARKRLSLKKCQRQMLGFEGKP